MRLQRSASLSSHIVANRGKSPDVAILGSLPSSDTTAPINTVVPILPGSGGVSPECLQALQGEHYCIIIHMFMYHGMFSREQAEGRMYGRSQRIYPLWYGIPYQVGGDTATGTAHPSRLS